MNYKKVSQLQEKRVAKEVKGKVTISSGAIWCQKGDVRNDNFLIECKTTKKDNYIFKLSTWDKIKKEAIKDGLKSPAMCIEFNNDSNKRFAILEIGYLDEILNYFKYCADNSEISTFFDEKQRIIYHSILSKKDYTLLTVNNTKFVIIYWDTFLRIFCN